jgi:hypothetical protein
MRLVTVKNLVRQATACAACQGHYQWLIHTSMSKTSNTIFIVIPRLGAAYSEGNLGGHRLIDFWQALPASRSYLLHYLRCTESSCLQLHIAMFQLNFWRKISTGLKCNTVYLTFTPRGTVEILH